MVANNPHPSNLKGEERLLALCFRHDSLLIIPPLFERLPDPSIFRILGAQRLESICLGSTVYHRLQRFSGGFLGICITLLSSTRATSNLSAISEAKCFQKISRANARTAFYLAVEFPKVHVLFLSSQEFFRVQASSKRLHCVKSHIQRRIWREEIVQTKKPILKILDLILSFTVHDRT